MIVICEECGKRYQVKAARFKCKSCGQTVKLTNLGEHTHAEERTPQTPEEPDTTISQSEYDLSLEDESPEEPLEPPPSEEPDIEIQKPFSSDWDEESTVVLQKPSKGEDTEDESSEVLAAEDSPKKGLSIRTKMILLFLVIPIVCIAAAGWLYMQQLANLSTMITGESTKMVSELAERSIGEIARAVADECSIYLKNHPGLPKDKFNEHPEFKDIAVQSVGKTGYTALYEVPGADSIWRTWAHANPKIIGIDMANLKKPLGKAFPGFWRVYTGVGTDKESQGYYTWQDKDGEFRDKFMVCTPVKDTPYIIAATTYLYEFTEQVNQVAEQAYIQTTNTRNILLGIILVTLILIGIVVTAYGHRVTRRIRNLTDAAEKISVGELDTEITDTSGDEIGELGEAISRMQDSIRLSLERLRKR